VPHFAYIVQSDNDHSFYAGSSHDPVLRCQRHNEGWTRSTKGKGPWKLVWSKEFATKTETLEFEHHIKKMKSRAFIEKLIRDAGGRPDGH
jgi:putative endonuclease